MDQGANKKPKPVKIKKPPPTGFEEFFADPPLKPDEYDEERDLYSSTRQFKDRIQTCIQRYKARRKLDQVRANVFTKYLTLGGVESGPKQFTGALDKETLENSTKDEITAMQATDYIRTNNQNPKFYDGSDNWVVDFESVAKGFFSHELPSKFPIDSQSQLNGYCSVVRNFLNYILHHEVCPEYTRDIMAAKKIIDLAEKELWAIQQMPAKLPGNFNVAASVLFGGRYCNPWGYESWDDDDKDQIKYPSSTRGYSQDEAERIFKTAIAYTGDLDLLKRILTTEVRICKTQTKYFEVVQLKLPVFLNAELRLSYEKTKKDPKCVKPLGTVVFKPWDAPKLVQDDFTDDESEISEDPPEIESYWLEEEALRVLYVGLKLEVIVHELNVGIKFIDSVVALNCSFFTQLPNEQMLGYKVPVASGKPPPTEDDPDLEERIQAALMLEDDF